MGQEEIESKGIEVAARSWLVGSVNALVPARLFIPLQVTSCSSGSSKRSSHLLLRHSSRLNWHCEFANASKIYRIYYLGVLDIFLDLILLTFTRNDILQSCRVSVLLPRCETYCCSSPIVAASGSTRLCQWRTWICESK
jgi:hypothetical protein